MKTNKNKKGPLDGFKLGLEKDPFPKRYASPTAGQKRGPSRLSRFGNWAEDKVVNFTKNVVAAIKELINRAI